MITYEQAKALIAYDPGTGALTYLVNRQRARKGHTVTLTDALGYVTLKIDYVRYTGHRIAWLLMTGDWPQFEIDHINGVRHDNRWINLRDVPRSINQQNRRNLYPGAPKIIMDAEYRVIKFSNLLKQPEGK